MKTIQYIGDDIIKKPTVVEINEADYSVALSEIKIEEKTKIEDTLAGGLATPVDIGIATVPPNQEVIDKLQLKLDITGGTNATNVSGVIEEQAFTTTKGVLSSALASLKTTSVSLVETAETAKITVNNTTSVDAVGKATADVNISVIFDTDGVQSDFNGNTYPVLSMPDGGDNETVYLNLATIPELATVTGVKNAAGVDVDGSYTMDIVDSNNITTGSAVFNNASPIISFTPTHDGLPVTIPIIVTAII